MRRIAGAAALAAMAVVTAGGCGKAQARTPGPAPSVALAAPEPPPRLQIPVSVEPSPPPPATEKPAPTPAPARPRPTPTPTPTPAAPPTPPPAGENPPVLQAGSAAELEARAKERLTIAERDLARVSRASLRPDARDQYDSAARFVRMAKDALTARNVVYAAYCADKAATLASLLVK